MDFVTKLSLKDNFCSSPWFHVRVDPTGNYVPCRWHFDQFDSKHNIKNTSLLDYINSHEMCDLRHSMLEGRPAAFCSSCINEDRYSKVNGRQRQLLKSAIDIKNFEKTFCASPHYSNFEYSFQNQGLTKNSPVDLQIDLGNTCNSGCIMCSPKYSSRLHSDYKKLIKTDCKLFAFEKPKTNWANDDQLVDKFVDEISQIPNLKYLHLLGGETLYLPSFYKICDRLIEKGLAKNISLGTTTNCTVYSSKLESIIKEFKHVHLGLSVEAFHSVNDYVRWPSGISQVKGNIEKFLQLRQHSNLQLSLRITPSNLTVYHLDTVFEFMIQNSIIAESCNLLTSPECLKIEILPKNLLEVCLEKINQVIEKYQIESPQSPCVNRRDENLRAAVIAAVIYEYKAVLEQLQNTAVECEQKRFDLVAFLQGFQRLRNNDILDYLPEYEEFLRHYGY